MITSLLFLVGLLFLLTVSPEHTALWYFTFPEPWFWLTVITSILTHANLNHLIGNFVFGFPYMQKLETKVKWKRFLWVYLMCGMWGTLVQLALVPFMLFPAAGGIGSSGAIFGMVAWALCEMKENRWAKYSATVLLLFFTAMQALGMYAAVTGFAGIGYGAHFGGICRGVWESKGSWIKSQAKRLASKLLPK